MSQDHVIDKLLGYVPMLLDWVEQFMSHTPMPSKGEIEFRRYTMCCLIIMIILVQQDS